jgi:hypothetical protein
MRYIDDAFSFTSIGILAMSSQHIRNEDEAIDMGGRRRVEKALVG